MDNKPRTPYTGNDRANNVPAGSTPTPAPLAQFDFDKDLDEGPTHPGPLMQQHHVMQPAKKSRKGLWATLIILLVLALAGAGGYFYWQNMQTQDKLNQKDSELSTLATENAKLKSEVEDQKEEAEPKELTPAEKIAADKTAITSVVTARIHAPTKSKDEKLAVNIMKQNEQFAYVNAGAASGGGAAAYVLKKVDNLWVIVFSGQDKIPAEMIEVYSIPVEFQSGQ